MGAVSGRAILRTAIALVAALSLAPPSAHAYIIAANVSGPAPAPTTDGLRLSFTRGAANSCTMTIDQLSNVAGVDNSVIGNLFSNPNQQISQVRLLDANGGPDVFFNNLTISAVPETSPLLFGGIICGIMGFNDTNRTNCCGPVNEYQ